MGPKQQRELRKALHDFIEEHGDDWPRALVLADDAQAGIEKLRTFAWGQLVTWASDFEGASDA